MHLAPLIRDLAVILSMAAIVSFIFRSLKQPVVLGYIIAGIVVGPYTPPIFSVMDQASVQIWAEIGVIFLMFALGLEFSFSRLRHVGASAIITGTTQIAVMIALGYGFGALAGWNSMNSIFLGCMIAISSTTIIIKSLEELGLKSRRFAELVIGVLIVEDLAAIVMLVALGNFGISPELSSMSLLKTTLTLAFVVGTWLIVGMFVVPRIVRTVRQRGTDELLIITSLALCFSLVTLSASLGYSVALGAFIMGSILSETKDGHAIEQLVSPLKDIFGAVFFVSVGMLLDPVAIFTHWSTVLIISFIVIGGKFIAVFGGALATGQSLRTSTQSALSMAQIGELSFVIATLGLNLKLIDSNLYPIIVAVSVLTTFTTPYLLRSADFVIPNLEKILPQTFHAFLARYNLWLHRGTSHRTLDRRSIIAWSRWIACAMVVTILFLTSSRWLLPWLDQYFSNPNSQGEALVTWILTFTLASPFIWGMLTAFKKRNSDGREILSKKEVHFQERRKAHLTTILNYLTIIILLGALSTEFMTVWISVTATASIAAALLLMFRRRLEIYFRWFEKTFISGLTADIERDQSSVVPHDHLLPWNGYLSAVEIEQASSLAGKTLIDLGLRERFSITVMVVQRGKEHIVAPPSSFQIFPGDRILCFGSDDNMDTFKKAISSESQSQANATAELGLSDYALWAIEIAPNSQLLHKTIRDSRIQERYKCMIVGLQRKGMRTQSPHASTIFEADDQIWAVGAIQQLQILKSIGDGSVRDMIKI